MEPEPLEPLMRYFAVEHAADLSGLSARIPGSGFLCFYPNDEEYEGFLELLEVLEPPFRVAYPVAPAVAVGEESVVSAGVLHTPEELAAYRARFADVEGDQDLQHQAHAVDGNGQHWTLVVGADAGEVLAVCFGRDEGGTAFSEQTSFDAESLPLPITVVELD